MRAALALAALLLLLFAGFACSRGDLQKSSSAASTLNHSNTGAELYADYCASCHGKTGRGDGPAAPALKIPPPDLTALARKNGGRFPAGQVYQIIEWGGAIASHGSREMPVWGVAFRPMSAENQKEVSARIHALTDYIASIQLQ